MIEFTASVRAWLEADPDNVIAVHCKGMTKLLGGLWAIFKHYGKEEKGGQAQWYACGSSRQGYFIARKIPWSTSDVEGQILRTAKLFKVWKHQAK